MSKFTSALIQAATDEWEFFGRSIQRLDGSTSIGKKEYEDGVYMRVNDYWKVVHRLYKPQFDKLTGKDRGWPWSAAFISYCMDAAGAGPAFSYSSGHATYINKAISARNAGDGSAIYRARRKSEHTLKPGDMVAYWWGDKKVTIENALALGWYNSHCDIVVEVRSGSVDVIGGNVTHSVTRKTLRVNESMQLTDTKYPWFVVLECQK